MLSCHEIHMVIIKMINKLLNRIKMLESDVLYWKISHIQLQEQVMKIQKKMVDKAFEDVTKEAEDEK